MKINAFFLLLLGFNLVTFAAGCDDEEPGGTPGAGDFDQRPLLENYAGRISLTYDGFDGQLIELQGATQTFLDNPSVSTLGVMRQALFDTQLEWQAVEPFHFGPAADRDLRMVVNPYPVDTDRVANLADRGIPVDYVYGFDRGLPALDYLLHRGTTDAEVVTQFSNGATAANARAYLLRLIEMIEETTQSVTADWANGYRDAFLTNVGTAAGTGVSLLINSLNEHWENTKRDRIGIPSGVATLGFTNPELVEARYSGRSLALLTAAVTASQNYFNGWTGVGLDDYLDHVEAEKNGQPLTTVINDQYAAGLTALTAIDGPLYLAVDEDNADVLEAYGQLVRNIVLLKTDMPSVLRVAITYVDNPSDSD